MNGASTLEGVSESAHSSAAEDEDDEEPSIDSEVSESNSKSRFW